jgi:hypothetical protein
LNEKQEIRISHPIEKLVKKTFSGYCPFLNNGQEEGVEKENAKWRDSKKF